jgi:hypothetical protein
MTTVVLEGKEYLLNVDQAEKLGLLKAKDNKVRSDVEFVKKYCGVCGYSYNITANMMTRSETPIYTADQLTPHEAKALAAFSKLLKLRRDWIGEWEPDWEDIDASYGVIWIHKNELQANAACTPARSLSFPTEKMAQEFLETFRDLIEEAKILI